MAITVIKPRCVMITPTMLVNKFDILIKVIMVI